MFYFIHKRKLKILFQLLFSFRKRGFFNAFTITFKSLFSYFKPLNYY